MTPETTTIEYALKPYLDETYEEMIQRVTTGVGGNLSLDEANTRITAGIGNDSVVIDAEHDTYRLLIGSESYELAPFKVTKAGAITATSGIIGGFSITAFTLKSGFITLDSAENVIRIEAGGDIKLAGDDIDPAQLIMDGSSYDIGLWASAAGTQTYLRILSGTGGNPRLNIGEQETGFYDIHIDATQDITLTTYFDASNQAAIKIDSDGGGNPNIFMAIANGGTAYSLNFMLAGGLDFKPNPSDTISLGTTTRKWKDLYLGGGAYITERASAGTDVATSGQLWVKNTDPNELWFTDGDGTDTKLA